MGFNMDDKLPASSRENECEKQGIQACALVVPELRTQGRRTTSEQGFSVGPTTAACASLPKADEDTAVLITLEIQVSAPQNGFQRWRVGGLPETQIQLSNFSLNFLVPLSSTRKNIWCEGG